MSINLNNTSQFLDEVGTFKATIVSAKMDFTRGGAECVAISFRTDDDREIGASYTEKMYWKLKRVAQAAGISPSDYENFEPEMLENKRVMITTAKTVKDDGKAFTNVSEVFSVPGAISPTPATHPQRGNDVPF